MRYLGLDVGTKTIGVAVSDELGMVASGLEVIRRVGWRKDTARLREIILKYNVGAVVVGLPIRTDGSEGPEAESVKAFAERFQRQVQLPVHYMDERFTSKIAEQALLTFDVRREKRRQVVDQVAAALILQLWLDRKRKSAENPEESSQCPPNPLSFPDEI